jgi:hypothetical protein
MERGGRIARGMGGKVGNLETDLMQTRLIRVWF